MNRRSFLSRSLLSAASFGIGSALPLGRSRRGNMFRSADAAPLPTPYPTLVIMIHGGLDPAMHMVATPNGQFGNVTVVNRLSDSSTFKKTASGILYVPSIVTPDGKTQFADHLNDVALIRTMELTSNHADKAAIWFGDKVNNTYGNLAWASQLTAQFRKRGVIVDKPCAIAYGKAAENFDYLDYCKWGTASPDPMTIADRILSFDGYFGSLSAPDLPPAAQQAPGYSLIDTLDRGIPAATQPDYVQRFSAANGTTNSLLTRISTNPGQVKWPPDDPDVFSTLGISASDLQQPLGSSTQKYEALFAFAYQALYLGIAHVIAIAYSPDGDWDSHNGNVAKQRKSGNSLWPALGRFLTLMKAKQSPIDGNKKLFDTTNIWIQSEMGRTNTAQMGDGTDHWASGSATFLGGRFKRGIAIGGYGPDWRSLPINPVTGKSDGGIELHMNNAIATVMKAAGGDPSEFTDAVPIDAVLDMSL